MRRLLAILALVLLVARPCAAAAIAFDAAATTNFGATFSWAHTCAADATLLYVGVRDDTGDAGLAVAYAAVAMTKVGTIVATGSATYTLWRLVNPTAGANNVVVTTTAGNIGGASVSYRFTRKASPQDVSTTAGPSSTATISASLTATTGNEWAVFLVADRSGSAPTANTNLVARATLNAASSMAIMDSNGATLPVGSAFTMTANIGASSGVVITESFRPVVPSFLLMFR